VARLQVGDADLDDIVEGAIDWLVGDGPFTGSRQHRLSYGIHPDLDASDLFGDRTYATHQIIGNIETRRRDKPSTWLMRWWHRDRHDDRVTWWSFVALRQLDTGVAVLHVIARSSSPGNGPLAPRHIESDLTRHLLRVYADRITPTEVTTGKAESIDAESVDTWVRHVLLAHERTHPLIAVSSSDWGEQPLLDTGDLAQRFSGSAQVVELLGDATWALNRSLRAAGASEKLGCFGGTVRAYRPRLDPTRPHQSRFLPANKVRQWAQDGALNRLCGALTENIAVPSEMADIRWAIDRLDAEEMFRGLRMAVPRSAAEYSTEDADTQNARDALLDEAQQKQDELQQQLRDERERNDDLSGQVEQLRAEIDATFDIRSVEQALELAHKLLPHRLTVLDSAWKTARQCRFRDPQLVAEVVLFLGLSTNAQDLGTLTKNTFGGKVRWRPKEGPDTMKRFGKLREFARANGERHEFRKHFTLGGTERPDKCCQIHYEVFGTVVEIARVGEHLPTVSRDT